MIKLIGAMMIVLTTTLIGFDISRQMEARTEELRDLIYSLQMMEAEMNYSYETLQSIFQSVGEKTADPIGLFYRQLARKLESPVAYFYSIWEQNLQFLQQTTSLKNEEIKILKQLGNNLGNHPISQQEKEITLTRFYLQKTLDEATEQKTQYVKTIKTISVLIGIFIVLILI